MFVYALTAAIIQRPELKQIELPAIYEIAPHLFFDGRVIQKSMKNKMCGMFGATVLPLNKPLMVLRTVIPANYTGWVLGSSRPSIEYFTGDIGLNAWYYNLHFNLGPTSQNFRQNEIYLFHHQQLLARYEIERQSNGFNTIDELDFNSTLDEGFFPNQNYYNGDPFPLRRVNYVVANSNNLNLIYKLESNEKILEDAIDIGHLNISKHERVCFKNPESVEKLGKILQAFPIEGGESIGFLESYSKVMIGTSPVPNAMQNYETKLRDSAFYRAIKRMLNFYWKFMENLPPYRIQEIGFSRVEIVSSSVTSLSTFYDDFDSDITNAVDVEVYAEGVNNKTLGRIAHYEGEDFLIEARSSRLNSDPFSYTLSIKTAKSARGVIRAFIGPKFDSDGNIPHINKNRKNFILLDVFAASLKKGINNLTRLSKDFALFVEDRTTFFDLYQQVTSSLDSGDKYKLHKSETPTGFPARLMLPKGNSDGWPCQLFFIVTEPDFDEKPNESRSSERRSSKAALEELAYGNIDSLPLGFPFDRRISERNWFTPNMKYLDSVIVHKPSKAA